MKGTLHKTESGWVVKYHKYDMTNPAVPGTKFAEDYFGQYPLIDNGHIDGLKLYASNEGLEVEFEIVSNEGEPLGKGEQPYTQYAKLMDQKPIPMKGGEGWDKILNKAIEDKAEAFTDGHYHYRGKDAFIEGYKQGQEDTKGMRYTEEDIEADLAGMGECIIELDKPRQEALMEREAVINQINEFNNKADL
jgi:hypothetical protein